MPYNPGVEDRSGELLARGISSAGRSIGAGLESYLKERKEKSAKAKSLRQMLKTYQPDRKEDFDTMGLDELEGTAMGMKLQEHARAQQSKETEDAARLDYYKGQRELSAQRLTGEQASAGALQRFRELNGADLPEGAEGPPRPPAMEGQRVLENASRAGLGPEEYARLASGIARLKGTNGAGVAPEFIEDPETGVRFLRQNNSVMPSGVNPLKAAGQAQELLDEEGNPTGKFALRTPKGVQVFSGANEERGMRDSAATIAQLEGVLTELDRQLNGSEARNAGIAGKQKGFENVKPVSAEQLQELRDRRARVKRQLEVIDGGGRPAALPGRKAEGEPKPAGGKKVDLGKAEEVRAAFRAGKLSKEEAVKRLNAMGYQ